MALYDLCSGLANVFSFRGRVKMPLGARTLVRDTVISIVVSLPGSKREGGEG